MKAKVKWFNVEKGYGFIIDSGSNKDLFIHYSNIIMDGFKFLDEDDIVEYNLGAGNNGKEQAVNVTPILTMQMVRDVLKKDNLYAKIIRDIHNVKRYLVVDENNVLQSDENGMSFLELAAYADFDTNGLPES